MDQKMSGIYLLVISNHVLDYLIIRHVNDFVLGFHSKFLS